MKFYSKKNIQKYDRLYKSGHDHSYPNLDLVRVLSSYIKPQNTNILDYGFGSGQNIIHLTKLGFDEIYGLEPSKEAIRLTKKKLNKIKCQKVIIKKLNSSNKILPYKNNFFDHIICTSVLSLLESKGRVQYLINEFHRILKPNGKLIVDINGPQSAFKKKGKLRFKKGSDTYRSYIKKRSQKIFTYCPSNLKIFSNFFKKFHIDELGEVKFRYFSFSEHEYIACLRKK